VTQPRVERSIASAYLRPLTLSDILDVMFELLTAHWRAYVLALGALFVPLNFLVAYLTSEVYGGAGLIEQLSNPAATEAFFAGGPNLAPFLGLIGVSLGSFLLATPFINGVACRIAAEGYEHGTPTAGAVLRTAGRRYLALVGVTVFLVLSVAATFALPGLLLYGAIVTESTGLAVTASLVIAGAIVLAVWVAVRLSLAYVVVVVEGAGPAAALRRSFGLVAGRFWRVLWTLSLTAFIASVVAQIVSLPFAIPGSLFGDWVGVVFSAIGGVVAAVLTTPLAANAQTLLYFDARVRREGYDLDVLTRELADGLAEQRIG
jgi:hypothetical protein